MNRRNRSQEKNKRSRSQKAGKQKSRKNSSLPTNQRTHLRNESEYSSKRFLGEYSDKGISGQYLRPNIHPIYQMRVFSSSRACLKLLSSCVSMLPFNAYEKDDLASLVTSMSDSSLDSASCSFTKPAYVPRSVVHWY